MSNLKPGFHLYAGNRLELLAERLAAVVSQPLARVLEPEIVVVQSRGMERWVSLSLARLLGACANCAFPFPNLFLQNLLGSLIPELARAFSFDRDPMAFRIMEKLPGLLKRSGFEELRAYLADDPNGLKRFQLSQKIADIFDQYLVFRPEMIFSWEEGKEPADSVENWQAILWQDLCSGKPAIHRARLRDVLLERIETRDPGMEALPGRVSIFGISYLPPYHLEVFTVLSRRIPVHFFLMDPCREYWADILSQKEIRRIGEKMVRYGAREEDLHLEGGNRLLASMGGMGRDFFKRIVEIDCDPVEEFRDPGEHSLLAAIQSDILNLRDRRNEAPGELRADGSVQFHACHSPMREVEVLHDQLLAMFEEIPDLAPGDILVMTPDIESYAPYIQAVFDVQPRQGEGTPRIPFHIADRSVRNESRVIDGFFSLLDMRESRFGAAAVLSLLASPGIREKFDVSDPELTLMAQWIRETGIRWGMDAAHRRRLGLPDIAENTWLHGIRRLLLGYALPGGNRRLFQGILPYDGIEGAGAETLGKLLAFLEGLMDCSRTLDSPRTLGAWREILTGLLSGFFLADEQTEREIQAVRRVLDGMGKMEAFLDEKLDLEVVKSHLKGKLEGEGFGYGFIAGGVTFCALLPMRSIPFRVIALIGMNVDSFPRESHPAGFDLMARNPRPGDRSRRNDDKYLFLEALMSAREKLYISYVGRSIQDNGTIPPSVLVSELMDDLRDGFGLNEESLVTVHRLHAFSPAYFREGGRLFSYSEENFAANVRSRDNEPRAFISEGLSAPGEDWSRIEVEDLCSFFSHPCRFLLRRRLDLYLEDEDLRLEERESFVVDGLSGYLMGQDLVRDRLAGIEEDQMPVQRERGRLPHGAVGEFNYGRIAWDAEIFSRKIQLATGEKKNQSLAVDLSLAGFTLAGTIREIYDGTPLRTRYGAMRPADLLSAWITHLVCGLVMDPAPASILLCRDSAFRFDPAENAAEILEELLFRFREGLLRPLPLFPRSSYAYARKVVTLKKDENDALRDARKIWIGNDFQAGEAEDPYFNRCFSDTDPIDKRFQEVSQAIFGPLLSRCVEFAADGRG